MDGRGTEARDTFFFDGWKMARSQWAARVRGVVYYDSSSSFLYEVVRMYIHQKALVRWRAFGDAMMNGGK